MSRVQRKQDMMAQDRGLREKVERIERSIRLMLDDGPFVTALPDDPSDGDRIIYIADPDGTIGNGPVAWPMIYYEEGSKWLCEGCSPLIIPDSGSQPHNTASTAYQTTGAPSYSALLPGTYEATFGAMLIASAAGTNDMRLGLHKAATLVKEAIVIATATSTGSGIERTAHINSVSVGNVIQSRYKSLSGVSANFWELYMVIKPVRVG